MRKAVHEIELLKQEVKSLKETNRQRNRIIEALVKNSGQRWNLREIDLQPAKSPTPAGFEQMIQPTPEPEEGRSRSYCI